MFFNYGDKFNIKDLFPAWGDGAIDICQTRFRDSLISNTLAIL